MFMNRFLVVGRRWGLRSATSPFYITQRCKSNATQASFRDAMASVASSPMIITTSHRVEGRNSGEREPRGITLSSITSLSLSPDILISFNIQVPSRTSEVLHDRGVFAINMLDSSPQSVQLCKVFAGQLGRTVNPFDVESHLFLWNDHGDEDAMDIPTIIDTMAVLYCEKKRVIRVQDHEIWIAKVSDIKMGQNSQLDTKSSLVYYRRGFHIIGSEVKDRED
jgi:flavin reductase (DIM6/NTAB) family NADH-FMN oxidoreductase RutF